MFYSFYELNKDAKRNYIYEIIFIRFKLHPKLDILSITQESVRNLGQYLNKSWYREVVCFPPGYYGYITVDYTFPEILRK